VVGGAVCGDLERYSKTMVREFSCFAYCVLCFGGSIFEKGLIQIKFVLSKHKTSKMKYSQSIVQENQIIMIKKIILISFVILIFYHYNTSVPECGFMSMTQTQKFSETEWKKCDNESVNYSIFGAEEELDCLLNRERMLCSLIGLLLNKANLKTVEEKLGNPIRPRAYMHLGKRYGQNVLYYPVGCDMEDIKSNYLVLYIDSTDIVFDYQYLK
jgi:hypothetical protein